MQQRRFTLEYWVDDGWYVGRLREVPGVFSQGKTMEELEDNIREAYRLMVEDGESVRDYEVHSKELDIAM